MCAYGTTADGDSADMLPVEDTVGENTTTRKCFKYNCLKARFIV